MKAIKIIISIVAIIALLVSVLAFSGSAQVLLEKLTGTSQGGNNELPENSDIEDGGSNLVWSENFEDCIFHRTTDTDGTLIYTTDNYLAFYSDGTETDVCEVSVDGDNSFLKIKVNETSDLYLKPRLNLAVDFTKNFNKEHLTLSKSKYIVMRLDIALGQRIGELEIVIIPQIPGPVHQIPLFADILQ